jgi:hypothetical protein
MSGNNMAGRYMSNPVRDSTKDFDTEFFFGFLSLFPQRGQEIE